MTKEVLRQVRGVVYGKWILVFCPWCKEVHVHTLADDFLRKADCRNGTVYNINLVEFSTLPKYVQRKIYLKEQII